jgi:hypothetical protein
MSYLNRVMRLNIYHENEYFTPHKDAQYVPSGNQRSLLSLRDVPRYIRALASYKKC